ncbi:MAG: hypothetical protein HY655_05765 [Acidobacteria bacterium]|nr:hypothetical protein [Acidobacteriota bacterium]
MNLTIHTHHHAFLISGRHPCGADQASTVFAIFLISQVFDGALTYWGVRRLGVAVEANTLLAAAMHAFGAAPALLCAKAIACVCGFFLHMTAWYRSLAVVTGACMGIGVFPWVLVLTTVS